jgi:hypothetical protein
MSARAVSAMPPVIEAGTQNDQGPGDTHLRDQELACSRTESPVSLAGFLLDPV